MIVFFLLAVGVLLFGCRLRPRDAIGGALSREQTAALNGFFVLLVFLSHAVTYVTAAGSLDTAYLFLKTQLGQLIVAPFLFFSGYGILLSFRQKGRDYLRAFPVRRFGRVLLQAQAAVLLFWLCNLCLGINYGAKRTLLAFVFWESIGNSNWYLFAVLALYVLVFLSFSAFWKKPVPAVSAVTALAAGLAFVLFRAGKSDYWYNTLLLFPLGMWFALAKEGLIIRLQKSRWRRLLFAAGSFALFAAGVFLRKYGLPFLTLCEAGFLLCLVSALILFQFDNRALRFFGRHVFSMFILQRIPMRVFSQLGLAQYRYWFVVLSFAATVPLAVGFDATMRLIIKKKD